MPVRVMAVGRAASSSTSSGPSASRQAAIAAGTTSLSGAAAGSAVQRSPLPRIQIAWGRARSAATVSAGWGPNSGVIPAEDEHVRPG